MHDTTSRLRPESVQTPDPTAVQTTIPITEAAARLGISADAVRKRIQRGKLTGHKTDTGWTVDWIDPDSGPETVQTPSADQSAVVARLDAEVAFLRSELEARTEEIRRRDVIIAHLVDQTRALPAGAPPRDIPQEASRGPQSDDQPGLAADTLIDRIRRLFAR